MNEEAVNAILMIGAAAFWLSFAWTHGRRAIEALLARPIEQESTSENAQREDEDDQDDSELERLRRAVEKGQR